MKKVIVLGASGFIGGRIIKGLQNHPVGYSSADCNLLSPPSIERALSRLGPDDAVIMLSAITRLRENSYEAMLKNIGMAHNIAAFIENHPVSHFIFFNTVDVYGLIPKGTVIDESLAPNPHDYYSISKLASEFILKNTFEKRRIPFLSLRIPGIYGPGDTGKSLINAFISEALRSGKITVIGDGSQKRDFVFSDDIVRILNEAIERGVTGIINAATGESRSILEIAESVRSAVGKECDIEFKPKDFITEKRQESVVFDVSLFKRLFPEFTFTPLKKGLSRYVFV